jgi:hypothetical protein
MNVGLDAATITEAPCPVLGITGDSLLREQRG